MMAYLSEQLKQNNLLDHTDIIILSDHGMDTFHFNDENVDGEIIDLYRVVDENECTMYGSSPVLQVVANEGHDQTVICNKLKAGALKNGNYDVYTDDDLDKTNWDIRNERRFGPCTVVGHPCIVFQDIWRLLDDLIKYGVRTEKCECVNSFLISYSLT